MLLLDVTEELSSRDTIALAVFEVSEQVTRASEDCRTSRTLDMLIGWVCLLHVSVFSDIDLFGIGIPARGVSYVLQSF